MTCRRFRLPSAAFAVLCIAAIGTRGASAPLSASLDVPGRSDATPWVAASGSFAAVAWGASADSKTDVYLAVSRDGGATFGSPVRVNAILGEARLGGERPPRVALRPGPGSAVPEVTVVWTARGDTTQIKTARSRDGGKTFDAPAILQSSGAPGERGWPAVAVDQRGAVHVIWLDHRGWAKGKTAGTGHADKSGGQHDGVAMAQYSGLYYASIGAARAGERELAKGVCYCCKTALAAGRDGTLFASWRQVYAGNRRDIASAISRDGGRSFSAPARVSEDDWAINGCPDDGPAIAVDAKGTAHLVWPSVIGGASPEGAVFYSSTRDGVTFTPRLRIPTLGGAKPSHPQIVVDSRGRTVVTWDESTDAGRVAVLRELKLQSNRPATFGEIVRLSDRAAWYPSIAATDKGLVAVWTSGNDPSRLETRVIRLPSP